MSANNDNLIERLNLLYQKVATIKKQNKQLIVDNEHLRKENETVKRINGIQKNSLEILEQKEKISNIAETVSNLPEIEKQNLKKAINQKIKEIDQCLKLLKV